MVLASGLSDFCEAREREQPGILNFCSQKSIITVAAHSGGCQLHLCAWPLCVCISLIAYRRGGLRIIRLLLGKPTIADRFINAREKAKHDLPPQVTPRIRRS